MMEEAIKNFGKQFDYQPVIENESKFEAKDSVVLCGSVGSLWLLDLLFFT